MRATVACLLVLATTLANGDEGVRLMSKRGAVSSSTLRWVSSSEADRFIVEMVPGAHFRKISDIEDGKPISPTLGHPSAN
jgi:hypothetical protein